MQLKDQVAIVTGGASGIGAAICSRFAAEGARVAVLDIDDAAARTLATRLAGAVGVACDVSDSASVDAAVAEVMRHFGDVNVLVNNAGILGQETLARRDAVAIALAEGRTPPPFDVTVNLENIQWDRMIATHLHGTFYCCRAVLRHMSKKGRGAIVNMASISGLSGMPGSPHYSAAKGGILAFTRSLAREVASQGIRVNALAPGFVETPLRGQLLEHTQKSQVASTPMGRVGTADEIATVAVFLASDAASFVTGETISPNGGYLTI